MEEDDRLPIEESHQTPGLVLGFQIVPRTYDASLANDQWYHHSRSAKEEANKKIETIIKSIVVVGGRAMAREVEKKGIPIKCHSSHPTQAMAHTI